MKKLMLIMAIVLMASTASAKTLYIAGDWGYYTYDTGTQNLQARRTHSIGDTDAGNGQWYDGGGDTNQLQGVAYDESVDGVHSVNGGGIGGAIVRVSPEDGSSSYSMPVNAPIGTGSTWGGFAAVHDRVNGNLYFNMMGHGGQGDIVKRVAGNAANVASVDATWANTGYRMIAYNGTTNQGYVVSGTNLMDKTGATVATLAVGVSDMEVDWLTNTLYYGENGGQSRLYKMPLGTGVSTLIYTPPATSGSDQTGIAIDPTGDALYYGWQVAGGPNHRDMIAQITLSDDSSALIYDTNIHGGDTINGIKGMDVVPSAGGPVIPEPAGLGVVGLALLAMRRRRS